MPKRQYRRRNSDEDEGSDQEEDEAVSEDKRLCSALEDIRDLQKMRKRTAGLSAAELALGTEIPTMVQMVADPLKLKTGGMIHLSKIKSSDLKNVDIEEDIKQTFSKESHLRDEDEEMRKYVEEELARKTGKGGTSKKEEKDRGETSDDTLYSLPEQLKKYQSKKNEEMLSNQMLCGIPEVDLGIDAKIRNIEDTEATKVRLLKEAVEKRKNLEEATTFRQDIVKDLARDYVRHDRYDISERTEFGRDEKKRKRPATEAIPVVGEDTPAWVQDGKRVERPSNQPQNNKPSDKYHYEKFKKKFIKEK